MKVLIDTGCSTSIIKRNVIPENMLKNSTIGKKRPGQQMPVTSQQDMNARFNLGCLNSLQVEKSHG